MRRSDIDKLLAIPYIQDLLDEAGHSVECFRQNVEEFIPEDTPNAKWIEENGYDPFNGRYNCERNELPMGSMTDFEFANGLYIHGEDQPSIGELLAGTKKRPIAWLTAGKERIRWLSWQNHLLEQEIKRLKSL